LDVDLGILCFLQERGEFLDKMSDIVFPEARNLQKR
jgi:hypothetical protein